MLDFQNFCFDSLTTTISHLIAIALSMLLIFNILAQNSLLNKIKNTPASINHDETQIFNNLKRKSVLSTLYITYKVYLNIVFMSFAVVFLYRFPLIAFINLTFLSFIDFILSIVVRPFEIIRDNIKLVIENFLFFLIYIFYIPIVYGKIDVLMDVSSYIVLGVICFLCFEGFMFRLIGYQGV